MWPALSRSTERSPGSIIAGCEVTIGEVEIVRPIEIGHIVFALALGVAMNLAGEKCRPVIDVCEAMAEAMFKLTDMVMLLAPYGVFGLMAWVAGTYGLDVLLPLGKVIFAAYVASLLHIFGFYGLIISLLGRLNPVHFFKGIIDAQMVAYTTSSSAGTLPVRAVISARVMSPPASDKTPPSSQYVRLDAHPKLWAVRALPSIALALTQ